MALKEMFKNIMKQGIAIVNTMFQEAFNTILIQNPEFRITLEEIDTFYADLEVVKKHGFIAQETYDLKEKYAMLYETLHKENRIIGYERVDEFFRVYTNIDYERRKFNAPARSEKRQRAAYLLDNIDGKALDNEQKDAVVCEEKNCLVIAGAGSGKTLTIAGKVTYLVKEKEMKPSEILLITYTTKAAQEMEERIVKRLNIPVKVKTFHALGSEIIAQVEQKKASVQEQNKYIVEQYFNEAILRTPHNLKELINFYAKYLYCPPHVECYKDLGEYYNSLKSLDLRTLKNMYETQEMDKVTFEGEKVKSIQELMIANFLYLNGIAYNYEKRYKYEVADLEHSQYRPDFYLPEIELYIEHFGINREGKANWLPPIENKKYQEGIIWKRELHKKMGTKLYETYSFQFEEGDILDILERDLKKMGVIFKPIAPEKIYSKVMNKQNRHFRELKNMMWTFLNLFKSHHYELGQIEVLRNKVKEERNLFMRYRMLSFLAIFKDLFTYYQDVLQQTQTIDFNDMINKATDYVEKGKIPLGYKYIIIDEYQDIAYARYKLVKVIKEKTDAKLMAVGDDWQSIYRFAGSDMTLFTSFERLFGVTERVYIENTYRNSQELISIAGSFVTKNPLQIQKRLRSSRHLDQPIQLIGYKEDLQKALLYALGKIHAEGKSKKIMLLGRNNLDINVLQGSMYFAINKYVDRIAINCKAYPSLSINFYTAHKSKGLEAEEVIIINCKNDLLGFPNQLVDDPILDLVMTQGEYYMHGEERRLFYVALTRTRNHCFLLVPDKNPSIFIKELMQNHKLPLQHIEESIIQNEKVACPRCKSGLLVKRKGYSRSFLGCNNFPFCNYTVKEIDILNQPIKCQVCGGYMVKRKSNRGSFYGCTNYPECKNTM